MDGSSDQRTVLRARLDTAATTLVIVVSLGIGALALWDHLHPQSTMAARQEPTPPSTPMSIDGAPILGNAHARVALIEFSDFECPFCARSARELLPELDRKYLQTGKAFLAFRYFPLPIHKEAEKAAEAAECAKRQGAFWGFHDWAFQHQTNLDEASLRAEARALRLDEHSFGACLAGQASQRVKSDVDVGNTFSVTGTPTWFVGTVQSDGKVKLTARLTGAKSFPEFQKALDRVAATTVAQWRLSLQRNWFERLMDDVGSL